MLIPYVTIGNAQSASEITPGNVTLCNVGGMSANEFRELWSGTRTPAERLTWARTYWQMRNSAVHGTATHAAESMGMKPGTYRAYEREPDASKAIPMDHQAAMRFGRKFGVNWIWLLLGEGSPFDGVFPAAQERILRAMETAAPEQQEAIAEMVERLLARAS